jgi:hypothetical protein
MYFGRPITRIERRALKLLEPYDWPGFAQWLTRNLKFIIKRWEAWPRGKKVNSTRFQT